MDEPAQGPRPRRRFDTDDRLIAAVRGGSEEAFGRLYERHVAAVRRLCRYMLGSSDEAEDAVQHAFTAAYVDMMASEKPLVLRPWLLTIARHRCLTVIKARRRSRFDAPDRWPPPSFTLEVDVREDLRAVMKDIAQLPGDQRDALVLREIGGASYAEISQITKVAEGRARTLVFQARSTLRVSRRAREVPCAEIRHVLASSRGGELRRSVLRHHLRQCEGCRAFAAEQRARRRGFKSLLPLAPIVAFKRTAFGAFLGSSGSGGAALLGEGIAIKALVTVVVATGGGVAGVVASGGSEAAPAIPRMAVAAGPAAGGAGAVDHRPATATRAGDGTRVGRAGPTRIGRAPTRRSADRAPSTSRSPHPDAGRPETPSAPGGGGAEPAATSADAGHPGQKPADEHRPAGAGGAAPDDAGVAGAPGQSGERAHGRGAGQGPVHATVPAGVPPATGRVPGAGGGPPGQPVGGGPPGQPVGGSSPGQPVGGGPPGQPVGGGPPGEGPGGPPQGDGPGGPP